MKAPLYNIKGTSAGEIELPEVVFGEKRNDALVRQVILAHQANARTPVAHTKGRGEVRGGGKKPWKQKGTGRARHGSIRSPIWRGGGTTHGPRSEKDYSQKINRKMNAKALAVLLSQKLKTGRVLFVDALTMNAPKTKDAKAALLSLGKVDGYKELATRRNNAALILTGARESAVTKSFRNMGNVSVVEARSVSPVDVAKYRFVVFADAPVSIKALESRISK